MELLFLVGVFFIILGSYKASKKPILVVPIYLLLGIPFFSTSFNFDIGRVPLTFSRLFLFSFISLLILNLIRKRRHVINLKSYANFLKVSGYYFGIGAFISLCHYLTQGHFPTQFIKNIVISSWCLIFIFIPFKKEEEDTFIKFMAMSSIFITLLYLPHSFLYSVILKVSSDGLARDIQVGVGAGAGIPLDVAKKIFLFPISDPLLKFPKAALFALDNPANRKFMLLLPALFYFFFRFFPSIKKKKDTLFFIGFFLISFFFVYLQQILSMIGTFISLMFIGILWVNSPKINFQKLFIFVTLLSVCFLFVYKMPFLKEGGKSRFNSLVQKHKVENVEKIESASIGDRIKNLNRFSMFYTAIVYHSQNKNLLRGAGFPKTSTFSHDYGFTSHAYLLDIIFALGIPLGIVFTFPFWGPLVLIFLMCLFQFKKVKKEESFLFWIFFFWTSFLMSSVGIFGYQSSDQAIQFGMLFLFLRKYMPFFKDLVQIFSDRSFENNDIKPEEVKA